MLRTTVLVLCGLLGVAWSAHAGDKGTKVTLDDALTSTTPAGWKEVDVAGKFGRVKQFSVPKVGDDKLEGEIIIYHFGAGGGGGVDANLTRWKGMFQNGKSQVDNFKVGDIKVAYLDQNGTYLYKPTPMAPQAEPRPNHRMLAMVFESPKGPYFIRFVGPEKTVMENKKGFEEWVKNFK